MNLVNDSLKTRLDQLAYSPWTGGPRDASIFETYPLIST
jgi:hypothetical protein